MKVLQAVPKLDLEVLHGCHLARCVSVGASRPRRPLWKGPVSCCPHFAQQDPPTIHSGLGRFIGGFQTFQDTQNDGSCGPEAKRETDAKSTYKNCVVGGGFFEEGP